VAEIDPALAARFAREPIVWLTTVRPDGQPQSVPVWFVWEDGSFLLYSQPGKPKLRNIEDNPRVSLHLRGTDTGDDIVTIEATAAPDPEAPAADRVDHYIRKYSGQIDHYGWTPASFAEDYSEPIRLTPTTVRTW
jgi:PPOX class probable F420-dependent enzyme